MQWQWVINAKDVAQLAQAIVATGAIIIAAWLFWQRRKPYPRLKVSHSMSNHLIHGDKRFLHISVTLENLGERLFQPKEAYLYVQQIHPIHPDIVAGLQALDAKCCLADAGLFWPSIASTHLTGITELEPGESESQCCDFLIDPTIEVVAVYSRVENPAKKEKDGKSTGWNTITVCELKSSDISDGQSGRGNKEVKEVSRHAESTSAHTLETTRIASRNQTGSGIDRSSAKDSSASKDGEKVSGLIRLKRALSRHT